MCSGLEAPVAAFRALRIGGVGLAAYKLARVPYLSSTRPIAHMAGRLSCVFELEGDDARCTLDILRNCKILPEFPEVYSVRTTAS